MGTRDWHLARAKHHRKAAEHIGKTPEFVDWAVVALFYAAHQQVHSVLSGEPGLNKDERHPRKHIGYAGSDGTHNDGRGTKQLVAAVMPSIYKDYANLFEASLRTRYDISKLGTNAMGEFRNALARIEQFAELTNRTRPDIDTQAP